MDAITSTPAPRNEPVRRYAPGTPERDSLTRKLDEMGYTHVSTVTALGEYAVRGGLVDIWPLGRLPLDRAARRMTAVL